MNDLRDGPRGSMGRGRPTEAGRPMGEAYGFDRHGGMRLEQGSGSYGARSGRGDGEREFFGREESSGRSRGLGREGERYGSDEAREMAAESPIVKVIEVVAQSPRGWEDAVECALDEASRTIRNIKSVYVKDMQAIVDHGRVVQYRLVAKISFGLEPGAREGRRGSARFSAYD